MDYTENINYILDAAVLIILISAMIIGAKRGILKSIVKTFSSVISLAIAYMLHPVITRLINATPIFDMLKSNIADKLGLSLEQTSATQAEQTQIISSLPLPDFMTELLIENNNSVVYELLDVHGIADYICGYIANLIISIITMILLALVVKIILKAIYKASGIISRLPVIHQLNYAGGAALGLVSGLLIIWIIFLISMLFITNQNYQALLDGIDSSIICKILFDNNVLKNILMGDLF